MMHDPRCMTLTSVEFPEVCDCRTLKLLDEGGAFGGATWKGCEIPPRGWWCSREKGHAPPCAARHVSGRDWPDTRPTDPTRSATALTVMSRPASRAIRG